MALPLSDELRPQDVVKHGKNVLLGGVPDSIIKIPACGMSFVVDRMIRGAVQAAIAAERARVASSAPVKEVMNCEPVRAAMEE